MSEREITYHRSEIGVNETVRLVYSEALNLYCSFFSGTLGRFGETILDLDHSASPLTPEVLLAVVKDYLERRYKETPNRYLASALHKVHNALEELFELQHVEESQRKKKEQVKEKVTRWTYDVSRAEDHKNDCVYEVRVVEGVNTTPLLCVCEHENGRQENIFKFLLFDTREEALSRLIQIHYDVRTKALTDQRLSMEKTDKFLKGLRKS
jgi:hypothetical protein